MHYFAHFPLEKFHEISTIKQLCHLLNTTVGKALFEPILQCVPSCNIIRLVFSIHTMIIKNIELE